MQEVNEIKAYLEEVCTQIQWKRARKIVCRELEDHMEDQKAAFVKRGQEEKEAEKNAVAEMGDASIVGKQLDQTHRPFPHWGVIGAMAVCILAGLALQFALSFKGNVPATASHGTAFADMVIASLCALQLFFLAYYFDYTLLLKRQNCFF